MEINFKVVYDTELLKKIEEDVDKLLSTVKLELVQESDFGDCQEKNQESK